MITLLAEPDRESDPQFLCHIKAYSWSLHCEPDLRTPKGEERGVAECWKPLPSVRRSEVSEPGTLPTSAVFVSWMGWEMCGQIWSDKGLSFLPGAICCGYSCVNVGNLTVYLLQNCTALHFTDVLTKYLQDKPLLTRNACTPVPALTFSWSVVSFDDSQSTMADLYQGDWV